MTTPATDGDRARFEAWATDHFGWTCYLLGDGCYSAVPIQHSWEAWQAASAELADLRACVEAADVMRDRYERVWRGSPDAVERAKLRELATLTLRDGCGDTPKGNFWDSLSPQLLLALLDAADRRDALQTTLTQAIDALHEAEAILGGEYGDHYASLCNKMLALEDAARALSKEPKT